MTAEVSNVGRLLAEWSPLWLVLPYPGYVYNFLKGPVVQPSPVQDFPLRKVSVVSSLPSMEALVVTWVTDSLVISSVQYLALGTPGD